MEDRGNWLYRSLEKAESIIIYIINTNYEEIIYFADFWYLIKAGLLPPCRGGQMARRQPSDDLLENLDLGKADPAMITDAGGRRLKRAF